VAEEQPSAEKTEPASQRKIDEAKKRGHFAVSREVGAALVLGGLLLLLFLGARSAVDAVGALFELALDAAPRGRAGWLHVMSSHLSVGGGLVAATMGLACALALFGGLVQKGFSISMDPVKPQLSRANPTEGLKRLFRWRKLIELLKSSLMLGLIGAALFLLLRRSLDDLAHLPLAHLGAVQNVALHMGRVLLAVVLPLFALAAAFDLLLQRALWRRDLRMTKDEARREHKDTDGDPAAKSRRQRVSAEFMGEAPDLELLAYAHLVLHGDGGQVVALQFRPDGDAPLPVVLLKLQGAPAAEALALAAMRGVRSVHDDDLAAKLFMRAKERQYIPADTAAEVGRLFRV